MLIWKPPNDCSASGDHSYLFGAAITKLWPKNDLKTLHVLVRMLLGFSCNNCVGMAHIHCSHTTPELLNACVTGCNEFASS